ncbi:MAG: HDOD domain-containing protein, partial [Caldimonas sp.]
VETDLRGPFVAWLLSDNEAPSGSADAPADPAVERMFARLDEVIASEALRAHLLPRAPHVVPQLMKTLRDERYSSADVAQRISKDVVLTAEVIRVATSAERRGGDAGDGEIDLARAVAVIGTQGLRRAIANVVLRPIFEARGDTLSARAATRIWQDADRKARLCAALAAQQALDPFDGYLAGLLHNTGWSAALRAIDGFADAPLRIAQLVQSQAAAGLFRRRDALFGALVEPWQLGPALTQLAVEVGRNGLAAAPSTLGAALRAAERLATLYALAPGGRNGAQCVPEWAVLAEPVRQCWNALSAAGPRSS